MLRTCGWACRIMTGRGGREDVKARLISGRQCPITGGRGGREDPNAKLISGRQCHITTGGRGGREDHKARLISGRQSHITGGRDFPFVNPGPARLRSGPVSDYRQNAEAAKAALDGLQRKGRILRIRFATHGAALKVKNLHPYVSNELLEQSFSQFGDLERCIVIVDDRGKSTGEGIVEFVRKPGANSALRRINEGVFLLGVDPKPVAVEPLEQKDEEDGMPEKFLTKTEQYKKEREKEPRFAPPGTFEYEFGMRWKQLEELEKQRIEQIKKDTEDARLKLEDEMQNALYEYQAEQIRQDLIRQQEELRRLEELRNADRLRRQEQLEIRRQQDDRERAQAEERRRADMMMNMRQQEIASRRGPIDPPSMRQREEMMMADRYGDRMGERMPERMGERMPERMGERMPERMGDRMQERMGERMGDRMPERHPDRMGGQPSGFMWQDEKGRGEGGMRGEPQRGRDMRGSGAPPLQPPPVPPSGMGAMERGGPAAVSAAAAAAAAAAAVVAQNAKSSPKPLMQSGSGFGGPGSGAGGPNNPNAGPDGPMEEDDANEGKELSSCDNSPSPRMSFAVSKETLGESTASIASSNSRSPAGDRCGLDTDTTTDPGSGSPGREKAEDQQDGQGLWATDSDYRTGLTQSPTREHSTVISPSVGQGSRDSPGRCGPVLDLGDQDQDYRSPLYKATSYRKASMSSASRSRSEERTYVGEILSSELSDSVFIRASSVELGAARTSNAADFEEKPEKSTRKKANSLSHEEEHLPKCSAEELNEVFEQGSGEQYKSSGDQQDSIVASVSESYETSAQDSKSTQSPSTLHPKGTIQRYFSSENLNCAAHVDSYESVNDYENPSLADSEHSSSTLTLNNVSFESVQNLGKSCSNTDGKENDEHAMCVDSADSLQVSDSSVCQTDCEGASYNQGIDNYKSSSTVLVEKDNTVDSLSEHYKQFPVEIDYDNTVGDLSEDSSSQYGYKQAVENEQHSNIREKRLSSYKQHSNDDLEEMEEEDSTPVALADVYQSYEEEIVAPHLQNINIAAALSSQNIAQSQENSACWAEDDNGTPHSSADQTSCSATYTSTQNTVTEALSTSAHGESITNSSSATAPLSLAAIDPHTAEEDQNDGALRTGDQSFKSAAARQSALVPFLQSSRSAGFSASVNPSSYAGASVIRGMSQPAMMSSSSMHFAQHPGGGATILRQQSLSAAAGLNGAGVAAQATVVQQHALANGLQATSLLQQRTLTNGSQTMVVQQRTLTTGLGGMSQQTVVQQRVAPLAPSAALHASALRQHALASQAGLMHQRGVRLAQARVLGAPMLQAQRLGRPAFIARGGAAAGGSTTLLGPGLVRGGSQASMMQQLVRQRYLGGPVMPGRGVQIVAGRPVRVKMTYPRENMPMESNT
ncbi:uncharacterized protein LOC101860495 [Aplysia californica]|uniref:Uncharacterized protein LOC101860495 n=1 Tax=Aplysia californica TaxID=6500 RepID=A0ABM1VTH5_APLCA|nr:uncharacterized protein LOC101860495 [Aplysia californica]